MGLFWSICRCRIDNTVVSREDRYKIGSNIDNDEPVVHYSWSLEKGCPDITLLTRVDCRKTEPDLNNFTFNGILNDTVGKMPGQIAGQQFTILNCQNSNIYLFDNSASVNVDDCVDCRIFIGPCKGSTQPIVEESRSIRFACLQIFYEYLAAQLDLACLHVFNNNWSKIHDFTPSHDSYTWLSDDANPLDYVPSISSEGFSLPPVSIEKKHSLIPFSCGVRPAPSEDIAFVLFFNDQTGPLETLRKRCRKLLRIIDRNKVRLVQSKEVDTSATDLERIIGSNERKNHAGVIIGLEVTGPDPINTVRECAASQSWTEFVHVPDESMVKQQLTMFYNYTSMTLGV